MTPQRGTRMIPRMTRGEWLGGLLVVTVLIGAMGLADLLAAWWA